MIRVRIEGLQCRLTCSSITGREQVRWGAVWHQLRLSLIRFYRFAIFLFDARKGRETC